VIPLGLANADPALATQSKRKLKVPPAFSFLSGQTQASLAFPSKNKKPRNREAFSFLSFVIPLGFEPRTLTLKV
jgi:hypothetical protein